MSTWPVALAATIVLLLVFEAYVRRHRCRYCGVVNGHDQHCPYLGVDR